MVEQDLISCPLHAGRCYTDDGRTRPCCHLLSTLDEADCARDEAERGLQRQAIFHPLHAERGRRGRTGTWGPYNTFKGVPIESGLVVAFFESTGLEGLEFSPAAVSKSYGELQQLRR